MSLQLNVCLYVIAALLCTRLLGTDAPAMTPNRAEILPFPYCQNAAYVRRRYGSADEWQPALVYDTETGLSPQRHAYWSSYYKDHARAAHVVQPAPWVSSHVK